jgi:Tfp pilus assembly protein PilZ
MKSSDHPPLKEKRGSRRLPSTSPVSYATRGIAYEDFLLDVSAGGVFIETQAVFVVGQTLSLTFPMPGHQHYISVTGRVVRVDGHGIGVQFDEAVQELLDAVPELSV